MNFKNFYYLITFLLINKFSFLLSILFYFDHIQIFFINKLTIYSNILFILLCTLINFFLFSLNKILWSFPSRKEFIKLFLFSLSSVISFYFINFLFNRLEFYPRSIVLIHIFLNISFVVIFVYNRGIKDLIADFKSKPIKTEKSIIVGISDKIINFIKINESLNLYNFIHIFDISNNYSNKNLRSLKILKFDINVFKEKISGIKNILIDPELVNNENLVKITDICLKENIKLINISRIINSISNTNDQREIGIENLIPQLNIDSYDEHLSKYKSKTILITGSCGSIGSEITKKLSNVENIFLVCIDLNEEKMMELDLFFKYKNFTSYSLELCNLSDSFVLDKILKKFKPDYCFHAAAVKHVPFVETSPHIAIQVNVSHTINLAKLCQKNGVKKFNFISTDKAVNPNNIMGLSKRLAEIYLLNLKKKNSNFDIRIVRFGNVLNSSGSVIPIFKRNIKYNQKLKITHPDIKRYFMSIGDAVSLVIISNTLDFPIDDKVKIFILDMGEQIKILDLAKKFLLINNFSISKIDEKFIGLRPGEKLYEELNYDYENLQKTKINNLNLITYNDKINFVDNESIESFLKNQSKNPQELKSSLASLIALR